MELVKAFANPNRCMQRLGFLKHLLWRASLSATNNLATLGKDLVAAVSKRIEVELSPEIRAYVLRALISPKYRITRGLAQVQHSGSENESRLIEIELQDSYLADPNIFSHRGKLVSEDWRRYPYLAVELGLLRRGTFSLLVRGQAFLGITSEEERRAFVVESGSALGVAHVNPLKLTLQQRILLLFSLLGNDGDILLGFSEALLKLEQPFTDWQAGDVLPEVYRQVAKAARERVRGGDDLVRIQRLVDTASNIESWKEKEHKGRGARDEGATVRLEPLVDLGLLVKADKFAYRYEITDATRRFFGALLEAGSVDSFLEKHFFEATNLSFDLGAKHRADRETILPSIQRAYRVLKSPMGYVPIVELLLLAGIYAITENGWFFEQGEALELLKVVQREIPERVTFNVDRWGALSVVKIKDDLGDLVRQNILGGNVLGPSLE